MGMTRRQIREHIFRLLFNLDFYAAKPDKDQMDLYFMEEAPEDGGKEYRIRFEKDEEDLPPETASEEEKQLILDKLKAIEEKIPELDDELNKVAKGWKTSRMPKADLSLLRLALYEIRYDDEVPAGVAINEAVELAKIYGNEGSYSFINGILARFASESKNG